MNVVDVRTKRHAPGRRIPNEIGKLLIFWGSATGDRT
jgi:hypothetical protein